MFVNLVIRSDQIVTLNLHHLLEHLKRNLLVDLDKCVNVA